MYVSKELIKKTGYCMRNYMRLKPDLEETDTVKFVEAIGRFMRNFGSIDYDTKQRFIETLKNYVADNEMVLEDEDMFIREVIKNLPLKVWEKE